MKIPRPEVAIPVADFAAALLSEQEVAARADVIASRLAELLPGSAVAVYVIEDQGNPSWTAKATAGDVAVSTVVQFDHGPFKALAESKTAQAFEGNNLKREDYAHLDIRRTVASLVYVPLLTNQTLVGAIELVNFAESFPASVLSQLNDFAELAAPAIATSLAYESERNTSDPTIKLLKEMLEWASLSREEIHVTQHGETIDVSREASRAKFSEYFATTGARAFYALPLDDDQGPLGVLSFEAAATRPITI